ncbi:glycosyltransferase [Thioalkalivibrio sp. ALR17-21]|uniref:glycosyltransferase n=1 Tax=Thioalkalivibrio sp. ALR17-21 TaxID=1269813 RepID=UPI000411A534|nr:glycosyltransferase [Thioalkalivibrio sp. ALR17-21]
MADADAVLERINYWRPGVDPSRPALAGRSSLRIGLVGSYEFYLNVAPEGQVFLLEPDNYAEVLDAVPLDLVLVESAWNPMSRGWYQFQLAGASAHAIMDDLLQRARSRGCPTAFWLTTGKAYVADYASVARRCDAVFCADTDAVGAFGALGVDATYLPPGVQPARFHPFSEDPFREKAEHPVYFDGWADVDRGLADQKVLESLAERTGLAIFESRYRLPAPRLRYLPRLAPSVQGCLTPGLHPVALRQSEIVVSLDSAPLEQVSAQWRALKAAATGNVLVHLGRLERTDIRADLARAHADMESLIGDVEWLRANPLERARQAHVTWRKVMEEHTLAHRLGRICAELGLHHDWNPAPKVSVVTPTRRRDHLERILENYDRQAYACKELRIVVNDAEPDEAWEAVADRDDVVLDRVPSDLFTGACMNRAHEASRAEYIVKMDDDDFYGERYLPDIMLALQCVDADVFGKVPVPMRFVGESKAYCRRQRFQPYSVTTGKTLRAGRMWLGGNTLGYRRSALPSPVFPDDVLGAADSVFNETCPEEATVLVLDPFNTLTERDADAGGHTWRPERSALEANSDVLDEWSDLMV